MAAVLGPAWPLTALMGGGLAAEEATTRERMCAVVGVMGCRGSGEGAPGVAGGEPAGRSARRGVSAVEEGDGGARIGVPGLSRACGGGHSEEL